MLKRLSSDVCAKIRSGVAVTDIAQCVEELVVNSIDAGAISIAVRLDLSVYKIQVVDNGHGIPSHDLKSIGTRYHTSKCHNISDLENLCYYGYRGEALASISTIAAILDIESRAKSSNTTHTKAFKHGDALPVHESDCHRPSVGTTITVYDLFYNLPVRKKCTNEALEFEKVRHRMQSIALMHPNISFTLRNEVNGQTAIQTHKTNSIVTVFGHLFGLAKSRHLSEVSPETKDKYKIDGYIGKEGNINKSLQFIYVNKRLVLKTRLHKLINSLLSKSLKKQGTPKTSPEYLSGSPSKQREFNGMYVLNIVCPLDEYDITFDPKKTLIEFKNWDTLLTYLEETVMLFLKRENLISLSESPGNSQSECTTHNFSNSGSPSESTKLTERRDLDDTGSSLETSKNSGESSEVRNYGKDITTTNTLNVLHSVTIHRKTKEVKQTDEESIDTQSSEQGETKCHSSTSRENTSPNQPCVTVDTVCSDNNSVSPSEVDACDIPDVSESVDEISKEREDASKSDSQKWCGSASYHAAVEPNGEDEDSENPVISLPNSEASSESFGGFFKQRNHVTISRQKTPLLKGLTPLMRLREKMKRKDVNDHEPSCKKLAKPKIKPIDLQGLQDIRAKLSKFLHSSVDSPLTLVEHKAGSPQNQDPDIDISYKQYCDTVDNPKNVGNNCDSDEALLDDLDKIRKKLIKKREATENISECSSAKLSCTGDVSGTVERAGGTADGDSIADDKSEENPHSHFSELHRGNKNFDNGSKDKSIDEKLNLHSIVLLPDAKQVTKSNRSTEFVANQNTHSGLSQAQASSRMSNTMPKKRRFLTSESLLFSVNSCHNSDNTQAASGDNELCNYDKSQFKSRCDDEKHGNINKHPSTRQFNKVRDGSSVLQAHSSLRRCHTLSSNSVDGLDSSSSLSVQELIQNTGNLLNAAPPILLPVVESKNSEHNMDTVCEHYTENSSSKNFSVLEDPKKHDSIDILTFSSKSCDINYRLYNEVNDECDKKLVCDRTYTVQAEDSQTSNVDKGRQTLVTVDQTSDCDIVDQNVAITSYQVQILSKHSTSGQDDIVEEIVQQENMLDDSGVSEVALCIANTTNPSGHDLSPPTQCASIDMLGFDESGISSSHDLSLNQTAESLPTELSGITTTALDYNAEQLMTSDDWTHLPGLETSCGDLASTLSQSEAECLTAKEGAEQFSTPEVAEKGVLFSTVTPPGENEDKQIPSTGTSEPCINWTCQIDNASGKTLYVNLQTGLSQYDVPADLCSQPISDSNISAEANSKKHFFLSHDAELFLPRPRAERHTQANSAATLCPDTELDLNDLLRKHQDDEDTETFSKWRDRSEPRNAQLGEETERDHLESLLENWENPVFTIPQQDAMNIEADSSTRASRLKRFIHPQRVTKAMLSTAKVLGQVDKKFIACLMKKEDSQLQNDDRLLVIVDQHAAHERVRLENLTDDAYEEDIKGKEVIVSSKVTPPVKSTLTEEEVRVMDAYKDSLYKIGVSFEKDMRDKDVVHISRVPSCLTLQESTEHQIGHTAFLLERLEILIKEHVELLQATSGVGIKLPRIISYTLNSMACRGAVKFGDGLSRAECQTLLAQLCCCNLPFQCAHGRPSTVPLLDLQYLKNKLPVQKPKKPKLWKLKKT